MTVNDDDDVDDDDDDNNDDNNDDDNNDNNDDDHDNDVNNDDDDNDDDDNDDGDSFTDIRTSLSRLPSLTWDQQLSGLLHFWQQNGTAKAHSRMNPTQLSVP